MWDHISYDRKDLHNHVITQTAQTFVLTYLTRVIRVNSEHLQADLTIVAPLDIARLRSRYKHARRRLLLIEFENTLFKRDLGRESLLAPFEPAAGAVEVLRRLAEDPKNEVWLLSGLQIDGIMDKVAESVPGIGIV